MWKINFKILSTLLTGFLWLPRSVVTQNITDVKVDEITCFEVNISARIDPVSTTYTFYWVVSVDNGADISIAIVGLDGLGNVGMLDRGSNFSYFIVNSPTHLPNSNDPFNSSLIFRFDANANTNLVFKVISQPLNIRIKGSVSKPRCPMIIDDKNVSCSDKTDDCFFCNSTIQGNIDGTSNRKCYYCSESANFTNVTCPVTAAPTSIPTSAPTTVNTSIAPTSLPTTSIAPTSLPTSTSSNINDTATPTVTPTACNCTDSCPSSFAIVLISIGAVLDLVGIIILFVGCCVSENKYNMYLAGSSVFGIGVILSGAGLLACCLCYFGYLVGGIFLIIFGTAFITTFVMFFSEREKESKII